MNDEPSLKKSDSKPRSSLDARLAARPAMLERLHQIVDTLDASVGEGCDAHMAEDRVVEEMRKLGLETLGQWAREANEHAQSRVPSTHPEASRNGKKTPEMADDLRVDQR